MKTTSKAYRALALLRDFLFFFMFNAFIITCSTMLFVSTLSETLDIILTEDILTAASKATFLNVIFLTLLITAADFIRRQIIVKNPIKKICDASEKIISGDFSVRLKPINTFFADDDFNTIIDSFNKIAQELSGVETLRSDFISNVSHELKTPLAVVQNYGTLLQNPSLDAQTRTEYARCINSACSKLSTLISNILKLNKLENQQIYPQIREYNLGEQLCECLLQFENVIEQKKLTINADIRDDVIIKSDAELLVCVWNNLISNAVKFTQNGGSVSVSLDIDSDGTTVKISDTGCGMTPEEGLHIFEKFYQGDTSHATAGNGLGLALVKRVADIVNADIIVESTLNQGSTFAVRLKKEMLV